MLLYTPRLTLRPIEETDMAQMIKLLTNDTIKKTYMIPDFASQEEVVRLARRFIACSHDETRVIVGIAHEGELIGFINDVGIENDQIELGYALHPEHHGRGYMTEALLALMKALFAQGFRLIEAGAFVQNKASIRVMEKCGMHRIEKTEQIEYRGETHDCVYYAMENTEG